jgi:poly-gamma-glutamate system protein
LSSRSDRRRQLILLGLALLALAFQATLELTRKPVRQRDYELKLEAARRAALAYDAVRRHRLMEGAVLDLVNDPAGTGLIGPEFSLITNAQGVLGSKLTTLNPNWAGVIVGYLRRAGLKPGDPVAVALSGSFPGLNICVFAALETLELSPVVVTSLGASMWGATDPDFTWLDMERLFAEENIFHITSAAASYGGGDDMGQGLSPEGRERLHRAIARNKVEFLGSENIEDAITKRMAYYVEAQRGRRAKAFINVGGGVASLGTSRNKVLIPEGLSFDLATHNFPRKGVMVLMAERGIPIIHMLNMQKLAREVGLPVAPDYRPQPGEGEIFVRESYRLALAAPLLVLYCAICVLVLAPELRRGLFDRWSGRMDGDSV